MVLNGNVSPSLEQVEEEESESVWTEHASSQGKVYYYNKALDKSQWEKPAGVIKRWGTCCLSPGVCVTIALLDVCHLDKVSFL